MIKDRIFKLAKALCLIPTEKTWIEKDEKTAIWWLIGCKEGDQALPGTRGCSTVKEALENAEGWFAPELDRLN
jgi:hypothetical protein